MFSKTALENQKNGFGAEFNSGPNPIVGILIPATQFERRIFFKRLLGPPRRLGLTHMVMMTTESASSEFGGRQAGAGGSAKTRACIRGIPRSARGRGRVARRDATPVGGRARGISGKNIGI